MRQEADLPRGSGPTAIAALGRPSAWPVLAAALGGWVPRQRWFQGKSKVVTGLRIADAAVLPGEPPVLEVLLEVAYAGVETERYQVPLVVAGASDGDAHTDLAATVDGVALRDAVADPGACRVLAASALRTEAVRTAAGSHLRGVPVTTVINVLEGRVRPMGVEQTNSSVILGSTVLKVFRKLEAGQNPDVELTRALTTAGFAHVPAQHGSLVHQPDGSEETTLTVLSEFAPGAEEGWALACAEARAVAGGAAGDDFAERIRDLGGVVGRLHATLRDELGARDAPAGTAAAWAEAMRQQARHALALARARVAVPAAEVLARAGEFEERFDDLAATASPGPLIRVHGDLHLGQVLRPDGRWLVLDFEGEPGRPMSERRRPHSPLRDAAGMLRSFDYAAAQADLDIPPPLAAWRDRLRRAFLDGYTGAAAPAGLLPDPATTRTLLEAFELEKAVYELGYELANRPEWVAIPVGGILRLLDRG